MVVLHFQNVMEVEFMKTSKLIEKLQELMNVYGDLEVYGMCEGKYVDYVSITEHCETFDKLIELE